MKGGQDGSRVREERFEVVAVTLFGKIVVARYTTLEQAEWRARELDEEAERSPRGYIQYLARPARGQEKKPRPTRGPQQDPGP
jgi:hypothetical protein